MRWSMHRFFWLGKKQKINKIINIINKKYNECFQYAITVVLNHKENQKRSAKNNKN